MQILRLTRCVALFLRILAPAAFAIIGLAALASPISLQKAEETAKASLEGTIRDLRGVPVPDVLVLLEPDEGKAGPSSQTLSGHQGNFALSATAAGWYRLRLVKTGYPTRLESALHLELNKTKRVDVVLLREGEHVQFAQPDMPTQQSPVPSPEFSDVPNFAIAAVTDRSNMGLHGSDANVRTGDELAKEAAALKSASRSNGPAAPGAGDSHRVAGDAREKSGDPLGAVKEFEAAVKADSSEENYFAWGAELLLHHASQAAVQVFGKAAQAFPQSPRLLAGLGAAYYAAGQFNEAAAEMCRASDLNPTDAQPYLFLGKMEQAATEPLPCTEEKLARFANDQPRNAYANFYYGLVLFKKARNSQDPAASASAETYLRKAAAIDPALAEVYLQLGLLYNARGEKSSAMACFQKAVTASPQLSAAHYQLSLAFRRAGNLAKAELELKKYQKLKSAEDVRLESQRREIRQFVTVLQDGKSPQP